MARFRITIEATVHDEAALARFGELAAADQGFTPEQWRAYRESRGGPAADLLEWIPQCPAGATIEGVACVPEDLASQERHEDAA
jgi:hypothetical protein